MDQDLREGKADYKDCLSGEEKLIIVLKSKIQVEQLQFKSLFFKDQTSRLHRNLKSFKSLPKYVILLLGYDTGFLFHGHGHVSLPWRTSRMASEPEVRLKGPV